MICPKCKGTGGIYPEECPECATYGEVPTPKEPKFSPPAKRSEWGGRCCTCKSWLQKSYPERSGLGVCNHPKLIPAPGRQAPVDGVESLGLHKLDTGSLFGCIHHETK